MRAAIKQLRFWETVGLVVVFDTSCEIGLAIGFSSIRRDPPVLSTAVIGYVISLIATIEQRKTAPRALWWTSIVWASVGILTWLSEALRFFQGYDAGVFLLPGILLVAIDWVMFYKDKTLQSEPWGKW